MARRHLNITTVILLLAVHLECCTSENNYEGHSMRKDESQSQSKPFPDQADLLEVALHKLKQTLPQSSQDTPEKEVIERNHDVIDDAHKLQTLRSEHERVSRLVKEREPGKLQEVTSEKRKDVTSGGEIITEGGFDNSESELQTVKRKDDNLKKKDKHMLSNPTYQFFLIAILVFSGVGVFMAISVAIVYLVRRIKDDGRRRNTIEMDDKGHIGLYYQCSDTSNYSDIGSTCTSHSHLSDDVRRYGAQDDMMSPFSDDDNVHRGHMTNYNGHVTQPLPGKSWTTRVQPDSRDQEYGTFYNLNRSSSAGNKDISKMAEDNNWNMNLTSENYGLLHVVQDNKRPKSF